MENKRFCPNCGAEVTTNFCPYCGTKCDVATALADNETQSLNVSLKPKVPLQPTAVPTSPAAEAPTTPATAVPSTKTPQLNKPAKIWLLLPPIAAVLFSALLFIFFSLPQFELFEFSQNIYTSIREGISESLSRASLIAVALGIIGALYSLLYLCITFQGTSKFKHGVLSVFVYIQQIIIAIVEFIELKEVESGVAVILPLVFAIIFAIATGFALYMQKKLKIEGIPLISKIHTPNKSSTAKKPRGVASRKIRTFVVTHKKLVRIIAIVLIIAIICAIVIPIAVIKVKENNRFKDVANIELGKSKTEVVSILGEPDFTEDENSYFWVDGNYKEYKKLLEKEKELDEKSDKAESFDELLNLEKEYEKLENKLETISFKQIEINFNNDKAVCIKYNSECKPSEKRPQKYFSKVVENNSVYNESNASYDFDLTVEFSGGSFIRQYFTISKEGLLANIDDNGKCPYSSSTAWGDFETKLSRFGIIVYTDNDDGTRSLKIVGSYLTSITIPDNVTLIDIKSLHNCVESMTEIIVADGNPKYRSQNNCLIETETKTLLAGCKTSVIPTDGSVTSIGDSAFEDCLGLTSVTIPDSVTSIGYYAFYNCSGLTSITIPDSVTDIGMRAFYETAWYNNKPDGLVYAGKAVYAYNGTMPRKTKIILAEDTKFISDGAFAGYDNLTSITIPDSVTSIGYAAFADCSELTSVTIGNGVASIGDYTFYNCSGLTSITIPDSVTSIGDWAFYNCSGLTCITIPDSVTSIGYYAFRDCSGLTSIIIPFVGESKDGTENTHFGYIFGANSYYDNNNSVPSSLSTVIITGGTSIGSYAFNGCSGLTSITIPDSVTSIGYDAFGGCSGLTSINYGGTKKEWKAITKDLYWKNGTGSFTVTCTDGSLTKFEA